MSSADDEGRLGRPGTGGEARILDELRVLAEGGASGALRIDGDPGGAVYLDGGRLVFAEAGGVPDLGARLVGSRWLSPEEWRALRAVERYRGGLAELLVERGLIGRDDLLAVLRSASLDAITALTVPVGGGTSITGLRFAPSERPWAGSLLALEIETVRSEMARRAGLLAAVAVSPDALPVGADLRRPYGVIDRGQWHVASRMDGLTPLRELAWRHGLALYDTVESVGGLLREGLCVLLAPEHAAASGSAVDSPADPGLGGPWPGAVRPSGFTWGGGRLSATGVIPPRNPIEPDESDEAETAVLERIDFGAGDPPWAAAPVLGAPTPLAEPDADASSASGGFRHPYGQGVRYVREDLDDAGPGRAAAGAGWDGEHAGRDGAAPGTTRGAPLMPRRRPGESIREWTDADEQPAGLSRELRDRTMPKFTPATPDLLRRLLRGLRELD